MFFPPTKSIFGQRNFFAGPPGKIIGKYLGKKFGKKIL